MPQSKSLLIATRKSPLALWQANKTKQLLKNFNIDASLLEVITTGDKIQHTQLSNVIFENQKANSPHHLTTGKGLFIKEIQESLLKNEAHIAVHSMKDLPVEQTTGLVISALLPRANPCDVLVISKEVLNELNLLNKNLNDFNFETLKSYLLQSSLLTLKPIGTTSLRRQDLMKKLFSKKLNLQVLRGNVDTRLKKVLSNEYSAILLAHAGLERLNLFSPNNMFLLPVDSFIPATAQGVIAIECSSSNHSLMQILQKMTCAETCLNTCLERMVLSLLEGDCHSSIGVHFSNNTIYIYYHKGPIEKSVHISVTLSDLNELKDVFHKSHGIYSHFYENSFSTATAKKIKSQLKNEGLL